MGQSSQKYKFIEISVVLLTDLAVLFASIYLAGLVRFHDFVHNYYEIEEFLFLYALFIGLGLFYNLLLNGYESFGRRGYLVELSSVLRYAVFMLAGMTLLFYMLKVGSNYSRIFIFLFVIILIPLDWICRSLAKLYLRKVYKNYAIDCERYIVITTKDMIESLQRHLEEDKGWDYHVVGICLLDSPSKDISCTIPILSGQDGILDCVRKEAVDSVFFLCRPDTQEEIENLVDRFLLMGIACNVAVNALPKTSAKAISMPFANYPTVRYNVKELRIGEILEKRVLDLIIGLIGSLITIVLTPFIAVAIKLDSPGPVFFAQERIGRNGRRFKMLKFRSMYADAEEKKAELMSQNEMQGAMFKLTDDPRVTKVGRFLRRSSLDEFPQFFSCVTGDLSVCGTRPPTVEEFAQYNDYYRRRLSLKPGVTGLWQISGRSAITDFDEVVRLDLQYIDNWSFWGDIKIIFLTIGKVLKQDGAR